MPRSDAALAQFSDREIPDWGPLVLAIGCRAAGDFMWMYELAMADGLRIQAYKHVETRRYLFLDRFGGAFTYVGEAAYERVPMATVLSRFVSPPCG
jgi:hypothetical protein